MKKILSLLVVLLATIGLFACDNGESNNNQGEKDKPVIEGLDATATITVGESIDVLDGVTATDYLERDITSSIVVTVDPTAPVVNGVITPEEAGDYLVSLSVKDDLDQETSESMFLTVNPDLNLTEKSRITYSFDKTSPEALKGYEAIESGSEVDALTIEEGILIYSVKTMGNGDGDNKIRTDLSLEAGAVYTFTLRLKASRQITGVVIAINDASQGWSPYDALYNKTIGTDYQDYKLQFPVVEANDEAELLIQVGGNGNDALKVYLHSVKESSSINPTVENYDFVDFGAEDVWTLTNENGGAITSTFDNGAVTLNVSAFAPDIWNQKIESSKFALTANKVHKLSYTIESSVAFRYEFIAGVGDPWLVWSNPSISAGEKRVINETFTPGENVSEFYMFFQFGNQIAANGVITISDVEITEYDDFSETETRFTGLSNGFASFEGDSADALMYIDIANGRLVYEVAQFGTTDWHNKVFLEDVVFKQGSKYRVEFVAFASRDIELFFAINPMGQWNPKVSEMADLTTTAQTFSYETPQVQTFDQNIELLFQFGQYNTGAATIYFESITIIELA